MADIVVCKPLPLSDATVKAAVQAARQTATFSFVKTADDNSISDDSLPPVDVYTIAFGLQPHPLIAERVSKLFAREATSIVESALPEEPRGEKELPYGDESGYIYVFHDIADPANVLKIGRTRQTPLERLAEWERELAPEAGKSLHLLAAYPTIANRFAERIVQELLRCHHIANRINPVTGRTLEEFYEIENLMALKLFLREMLRFVNEYCTYWRKRRRQMGFRVIKTAAS